MQISLRIVYKLFIIIGLTVLFKPGMKSNAQAIEPEPGNPPLITRFIKPEVVKKGGELSSNIVRIINPSDSAIRIKAVAVFPDNWPLFSLPTRDTLVMPHDSISLLYRFQLPDKLSSEQKHEIVFRAYSTKNQLLSETSCSVNPESVHNWSMNFPDNRVFFYPRKNQASFSVRVENKGNTSEDIDLQVIADNKVEVTSLDNWEPGQPLSLPPYKDTLLRFNAKYTSVEDRVFDISKIQVKASTPDNSLEKPLLIEKYNDIYSPLVIDLNLPHQVELGFREFSGNNKFLPFIKARGLSTFKNQSSLLYNFNYYALTGNEDIISNSYYSFLYKWQSINVGLGAFSSQLGRNLYTRNGITASGTFKVSPSFYLEPLISQSIIDRKTSAALGYAFAKNKIGFNGSFAYDLDDNRKINTASAMLESSIIPVFKNHKISFNLYSYNEHNYHKKEYTLFGFAWDFNYYVTIGQAVKIQVINNYGSPNIPGPQMGLLNFTVYSTYFLGDKDKYFSIQYSNVSRDYYNYNYEGDKLPNITLYDQYANLMFHSGANPNHIWQAGPSVESYHSLRPSSTLPGERVEYQTQKLRVEYKSTIAKNLTLLMKTGLTNIIMDESRVTNEKRYDFHLMGNFSLFRGANISFSYDYGPMVNSGLYQFAGDAKNHSITAGPGMSATYLKNRLRFNLFSNFTYRIDLKYGAVNINPKLETYLFRNWYVIVSGTYHYTRQQYPDQLAKNSYLYLECSIKKNFGRSNMNKWQKRTRQLRVIMFKDDNNNGVKDLFEEGIPYVKTRVVMTNSDDPTISTNFPVDIVLMSNEKGQVTFNSLPTGFYDLSITPMGDVKEYFFVDRSINKVELTKNQTQFIPFQKATKLTGKISVERQKFIKKGEENLDLKNIKVTAYNNQGNSYSSFTLDDGSFTLFVPGNNSYYIRMGNVFGSGYRITNNDINVFASDTTSSQVEFKVVEVNRQVKFKGAKPAQTDTTEQKPLKIKVLQGKFYENSGEEPVNKDAAPEFNIKEAPIPEEPVIPGNHYVVISEGTSRQEASSLIRIVRENGIEAHLGYDESEARFYVFTKYFQNKGEAKDEQLRLQNTGIKEADVIKF